MLLFGGVKKTVIVVVKFIVIVYEKYGVHKW
jgi:hypothetical protein